jgi:hypothetical protein
MSADGAFKRPPLKNNLQADYKLQSMALKCVEMRGAAEGASIRAPNAAGGRVYDKRHPGTRIEANAIQRYWD